MEDAFVKSWFNLLFAAILFAVWAIPPQAAANPLASLAAGGSAMNLRAVFTLEKSKPFVISLVDKEGKVVSQFLTKPTNDLSNYLPSKMAKEMKKVAPYSFLNMAGQKLKRFPVESFGFLISLGAIVAYDLFKNAGNNPVGFEQLLQSQLDPVGQLGFYAFMVANGAAAEPFMHMIQNGKLNPRFAPFINYAGMSVGMVASNIVHEIGHWPGLAQCAKDLWSKSQNPNYKNCDQAASAWSERGGFGGLTNQWAPGLISLIGSTLLASAVHGIGKVVFSKLGHGLVELVIYSGRWTMGRVIQVTAVELAFMAVPGGIVLKGVRLVSPAFHFLAQLTLFNGIQHWLDAHVVSAYNNFFQSGDLKESDEKLIKGLLGAKNQNWDAGVSAALAQDVSEFGKQMRVWRQMNLSQVLQTHMNWEQKLGQLTVMYSTSEMFYSDFINRIWHRKYGPYKDAYATGQATSILDMNFPLNGVTVAAAEAKDETTWLEAPDQIEERQMLTIRNIVQALQTSSLSKEDHAKLEALKSGLVSSDRVQVGKALDQLNCYLHMSQNNKECKWENLSKNMHAVLWALRKSIGDPRPLWQPGLGYLVAFGNTPGNKNLIEKALYQKSFGLMPTMTLPESMIASMFYGPDVEKGESTVEKSNGYKDLFKPPRIRSESAWRPSISTSNVNQPMPNIVNSGIYTYFNRGYISPKILGPNPDTFRNWWKQYPETDYLKAWVDYEKLYQMNIARLIKVLHADNSSSLNRGPVSNGLLHSLNQEIRLYTMVLGEIMKDSYLLQTGQIPEEAFSKEQKILNLNAIKDQEETQLLTMLRNNKAMDFSAMMKFQKVAVNPKLDFSNRRNLVWQDQLLAKADELHNLVKGLQVRDIRVNGISAEQMPVSTLNSKDLEMKMEEAKQLLAAIKSSAFPDELALNPAQKKLIEVCWQGIQQNLSELKGIADAANAASYIERHDGQGHMSRRCQISTRPQQSGLNGIAVVQRAAEGC